MASSLTLSKLVLSSSHLTTKYTIPSFVYGTAWKKDRTADLVYTALSSGNFTAIDTACQPKHYREDLVGQGVRNFLQNHPKVKRSDLYIQTKFTSINGQDPEVGIPYDPKGKLSEQVQDSIQTSLTNFTISKEESPYLDTVVLHSPMPTIAETMEVWGVLEYYVQQSKILHLGLSNCNLFTLMDLYEKSTIKPSVVQNRFYSATKYDIGVRKFCSEKGIIYQSFWTLTGNPQLLKSRPVLELVRNVGGIATQGALYALVIALGNTTVLNGTTSQEHMLEDWNALEAVRTWAGENPKEWASALDAFKRTIGELR